MVTAALSLCSGNQISYTAFQTAGVGLIIRHKRTAILGLLVRLNRYGSDRRRKLSEAVLTDRARLLWLQGFLRQRRHPVTTSNISAKWPAVEGPCLLNGKRDHRTRLNTSGLIADSRPLPSAHFANIFGKSWYMIALVILGVSTPAV
jgi:hypothetical protein